MAIDALFSSWGNFYSEQFLFITIMEKSWSFIGTNDMSGNIGIGHREG